MQKAVYVVTTDETSYQGAEKVFIDISKCRDFCSWCLNISIDVQEMENDLKEHGYFRADNYMDETWVKVNYIQITK